MIQKLQNRFIRIAMCSMAVVLLVVALGINGLNLAWNLGVVKEKMQTLVSNGGVFLPDRPKEPPKEKWDSEERYRMRYFTVYVEESGNMICNTQHIVTVSDAEAKALAERLLKTGREEGLVKHCLYRVTECDTGKLILFVDCYPEIRQCGSLVLISLGIIVISFFLLFIPVKILSGRALRPVQEGFTRQKQFITDAGHEIKTPLSIISANVDVLALEGQENEWLKSIRNQVKRLSLLANDLSLLARMDEEELTSSVEEFSLSEAVREATSPFFFRCGVAGEEFCGGNCTGSENDRQRERDSANGRYSDRQRDQAFCRYGRNRFAPEQHRQANDSGNGKPVRFAGRFESGTTV